MAYNLSTLHTWTPVKKQIGQRTYMDEEPCEMDPYLPTYLPNVTVTLYEQISINKVPASTRHPEILFP